MLPMLATIRMAVAVTGAISVSRGMFLIGMIRTFTGVGVVCAATHQNVGGKCHGGQDSPQPDHVFPH